MSRIRFFIGYATFGLSGMFMFDAADDFTRGGGFHVFSGVFALVAAGCVTYLGLSAYGEARQDQKDAEAYRAEQAERERWLASVKP